MPRVPLVLALAGLAVGVLPGADGYRFPMGKPIAYRYVLDQEVAMATAGDHLQSSTRIVWNMTLEGLAGDPAAPGLTPLRLAIQAVQARHQSPGMTRTFDSTLGSETQGADPLLGGLQALAGASLILYLDPATGRVPRVAGGDRLAAAFARLHPNPADPSAPSPLAAGARTVFDDAALARQWTGILLLPGPTRQDVPAGSPLTGRLVRTWTGTAWSGSLEPGRQELTLDQPPLAVTGVIDGCTAQGELVLADGVPAQGRGGLAYTLTLTAMTQPVLQQHRVTWQFQRQP